EHGKSRVEALASIEKGNETVEWAISLPSAATGRILEVSRGITCQERRDPLGVVASIVPFNFPIMVPMWFAFLLFSFLVFLSHFFLLNNRTIPIALTSGNCVILKPSEKVPMTMSRVAFLLKVFLFKKKKNINYSKIIFKLNKIIIFF